MAALKRAALFCAVFVFLCGSYVFAEDQAIRDEINQLKRRIQALEDKISNQDKHIVTQNTTVQAQQQVISEYESRLSQFEEKLKRVPAERIQLMQGLELGVGGTFVVQGTNNVNYNAEGQSLKSSRTDGTYSTDITLSKEFEDIDSRAFLHLENGQGAGLEDAMPMLMKMSV